MGLPLNFSLEQTYKTENKYEYRTYKSYIADYALKMNDKKVFEFRIAGRENELDEIAERRLLQIFTNILEHSNAIIELRNRGDIV